ncbi:glycosyltransferase family 2 protein [Prosthecobacter sp.]|uniref:glycosyltransferase family 2 protein n=1 Tax=Prosthecobacter sp. TaxID=1965333 RepID=UPI00378496EB
MKLFLALPVYDGYDPHFINSLLHLQAEQPCSMIIRPMIGDSLVSRARNSLAADFLASDATHLLFLDTDLIFTPEHIKRLLSHDEPIVAGLYPKKQPELAWVCNVLPGEAPDARGLQRVKYIGTGCLLIRRDVLERMIAVHPECAYVTDAGQVQRTEHDLFPVGPMFDPEQNATRYHSEDWGFCRRALDLGYEIWADTRVALKHVGQCVYPLVDPFAQAA